MKPFVQSCIVAAALSAAWASFAVEIDLVVLPSGAARFECAGKEIASMAPALFEVPWRHASLGSGKPAGTASNGIHHGQIKLPGGGGVKSQLRIDPAGSDFRFHYELTPQRETRLNSLNVTLTLPSQIWAGGAFSADGKQFAIPTALKEAQVRSGPTKSLHLVSPTGSKLHLNFSQTTSVLFQDDRQWAESFSVRIEATNSTEVWPAGTAMHLAFTLASPDGLRLEEDGPVTILPGKEWLPLEPNLEIEPGSALDFSTLVPRHKFAGEFGRVIASEHGKFAFQARPAVSARFYGVNLCFSAQYLSHEESDQLADRLSRQGYNALRIHHYEGDLVERGPGNAGRFKTNRLDQLDYLIAAVKRRGIYITTDLFVSRPVPMSDIYEGATGNIGMDEFKMAVPVNARAFENYKAFARALLGHENPYTKLRYADDPAVAWLSLVNENCPGNFIAGLQGKLRDDWQRAWNRWLAARYRDRAALARALGKLQDDHDPVKGNVPLQSPGARGPASVIFNVFLAETEASFFERTRRFLREELHCPALLTDCNAWSNPVQLQAVRSQLFDYVDDHFYVDHPEFIERPWSLPSRCSNTSPIAGGARGGRSCAFTRLMGKPFTITEFNYSAPGRFRGVGGILTGAMGAIQDWDGLWRFAYSHSREGVAKPGPMNYFDIAGDPLNMAAERASLCLFLRGDIRPAKHSVVLSAEPAELMSAPQTSCDKTPSWQAMAWITRVGWIVGNNPQPGPTDFMLPLAGGDAMKGGVEKRIFTALQEKGWVSDAAVAGFAKNHFQCENGEVTIDAAANILTLDTPLTAGGFAPSGLKIVTRAASFEVMDSDATVWVSSLDNRPIPSSRRLLLSHLTDLQNNETRYGDRSRQVLLAWGRLPHLVRAGRAVVELQLDNAQFAKVFALNTGGKRIGLVATSINASGALSIPLSVAADGKARMLYEVEVGK